MNEELSVAKVIVAYIQTQHIFEFEPKPHHYLIEDLNFDSLDIIELSIHLEEIYDISIEDGYMFKNAETLDQLINLLKIKYGLS